MASHDYDVVVAGAGPGGSTAALLLAREGFRVLVLEKDSHPRFHIGESILPRNASLMKELGLWDELQKLPHVPKYGAEFAMGNDPQSMCFTFDQGLIPGAVVFNIERSVLDAMLVNAARDAGADVRENTPIERIVRLYDGDVAVSLGDQTITAKYLLDASGHGTIVGRHLGARRSFDDPKLQKVAYFEHFDGVERLAGNAAGHPAIIMCEEGWFWIIALNETRTSVGFVTRPEFVKQIGVPPERILAWAIERCPVVKHRMRSARGPQHNRVLSDFSYTCAPHAGPGYFLVGDAGCFLDPIFSTGVTLAMVGAVEAARCTAAVLRGATSAHTARRRYARFVIGSTSIFWGLIRAYYEHSFRELFMNGRGPLQVHNAIISILAGHVFPRPPFKLRWRLWFFHLCVKLQKWIPLCPRRLPHSLLKQQSNEISAPAEAATA